MNPTLGYLWSRLRGAMATSPWTIRRLVHADLQAGPPAAGEFFQGQKTLLVRCNGLGGNLPYYIAQTAVSAALAAAFGISAYVLAKDAEPGPWSMPLAGAMGAVSALCLYQAVARRFGPAVIDKARYERAGTALHASGDGDSRPMGVLLTVIMAAMFLVDGCFSGYTLTTTAFASMFTPRVAMASSLAWSIATAWLLYHLTSAAAREAAVNARRAVLRNLLSSPRPTDRQRGDAMVEHVGPTLGGDYGKAANRYRARVGLVLVVLGLSLATLVVRVSAENDDVAAHAAPAAMASPLK